MGVIKGVMKLGQYETKRKDLMKTL